MDVWDVRKTRELGLCLSCEICSAICPEDAIEMERTCGQFLPTVDGGRCTGCGLCLEICPGIELDPLGLRNQEISEAMFDGPWLKIYTAHSNDLDVRKNAASGGLITTLLIQLIGNREFDAAFVLPFDIFTGEPARLKATNKASEILNAAKSKYVPASAYNVIMALKEKTNRRYIIVGTPCQIYGIKKYTRKNQLSEENLLFLGLFCEKTLNFNAIQYFEDTYRKSNEELVKFEFRTKEKYGWPGHSKACFNTGRELIVDRSVRMQLKPFFQLKRCLFCVDRLNRLADISFGDCYIGGEYSFHGRSSVIIRTRRGDEIFSRYSHFFTLENEGIEAIRTPELLASEKDNLEYAKILIEKAGIHDKADANYGTNKRAARKLSRLEKYVEWGTNYKLSRIRLQLLLLRAKNRLKTVGLMIFIAGVLGSAVVKDLIGRRRRRRKAPEKSAKGNVVLFRRSFFNKGDQAMTFATVDQVKRRFPNKNIYLFSSRELYRRECERGIYKFVVLPWDIQIRLGLLGCPGVLFRRVGTDNNSREMVNRIREIIRETELFIGAFGYAVSSNWGFGNSVEYLLNIMIARRFSVPLYILPQSIGPFDYSQLQKILLYPLMKLYFRYPARIFIREEEGLKLLRKFTKRNVAQGYDIVLTNKEYILTNIYADRVEFREVEIKRNSVGIIPNIRVLERMNREDFYRMYRSLIKRLTDAQKTVYLLRHSHEDLDIIEEMSTFFPNDRRVKLMRDDMNAIELENLIRQFDFVIASRYHSIAHAYKNGVPVIAIGWAAKYSELLASFNQAHYCVDVRDNLNIDEVVNKAGKMINDYQHEREEIVNRLTVVQKASVFDIFDADGSLESGDTP